MQVRHPYSQIVRTTDDALNLTEWNLGPQVILL